ncbi:MAG: putative lipid II flippase FtsW [Candidatus Acidiferrales bacterium]
MPRSLQPDWKLFGSTVALCLFGAVMVFSATAVTSREQGASGYAFLLRQLAWLMIGFAGMFLLMNTDYRKLRQPRVIFSSLGIVILMLLAVLLFDRTHHTHRWIHLGSLFRLQPSELAKFAVILYLAWFLEMRQQARDFNPNDFMRTLGPALLPVLLIFGLVLVEPDMGTASMILFVGVVLLYLCGLSEKYLGYAAAIAAPVFYLLIVRVPYRYERVMAFLNPSADPQRHGFQLLQSLIAVGSGGLTGVGLMESRQKLFYLPEAHTDFIFAVLGEELGFLGAALVLALFAVYGWRGLRAALKAPDEFGRLLGFGITTLVVGQAFINLSVVLGLMPTKGIPLPFVSYGGSSLLVMLLATGVLLNISQHADEG